MPSKIKKRGKNSYRFSVPNRSGKPFEKTMLCESDEEAKRQYKLFEADCLKGLVLDPSTPRMTLKQFYAYWKKHYAIPNLSIKSITSNDSWFVRLEKTMGHLYIDKIKSTHVLQLLEQLQSTKATTSGKLLSAETVRKHYILLNELLNFAVKWDFIIFNPLAKLDPPKRDRKEKELPSPEEFGRFLYLITEEVKQFHAIYLEKPKQYKRYVEALQHQLWVMLAFMEGMRTEEIFGIQRQDIEDNILDIKRAAVYVSGKNDLINELKHGAYLSGNSVVIQDTKSFKSKRKLLLSPPTLQILNKYILESGKHKPIGLNRWIFSQNDGNIAHPPSFNRFMRRFCKRHSLPRITPHTLRHLHGSYAIQSGVDLARISSQLGHEDKAFTFSTYIHVIEKVDDRVATTMQGVFANLINKNRPG